MNSRGPFQKRLRKHGGEACRNASKCRRMERTFEFGNRRDAIEKLIGWVKFKQNFKKLQRSFSAVSTLLMARIGVFFTIFLEVYKIHQDSYNFVPLRTQKFSWIFVQVFVFFQDSTFLGFQSKLHVPHFSIKSRSFSHRFWWFSSAFSNCVHISSNGGRGSIKIKHFEIFILFLSEFGISNFV